jgi:hypothetical protein
MNLLALIFMMFCIVVFAGFIPVGTYVLRFRARPSHASHVAPDTLVIIDTKFSESGAGICTGRTVVPMSTRFHVL